MPKTTLPLREDEVAVIKALPNDRNCVAHPEWVGPHEFNGVGRYAGLSVAKHTIRSATAITELWEAPDLDCTIVYQKTLFLDAKGEPSDANVRSAFAIQRQEPESWIFAANAGKQVPPAAVGRF
ncbi:MAG TPA: hypothetical protein VMZ52_16190 [Bryobacteraceae bacterium]|nr:hypothetical protein [Bryobacteraceae bacterium]